LNAGDADAAGLAVPVSIAGDATPCTGCNGVGSIIVSLCCGRGCATCVGDQMQAVECYGCRGTGLRPA
jgi:hypothetical protein